jgi:hypothetical protein
VYEYVQYTCTISTYLVPWYRHSSTSRHRQTGSCMQLQAVDAQMQVAPSGEETGDVAAANATGAGRRDWGRLRGRQVPPTENVLQRTEGCGSYCAQPALRVERERAR